MLVHWIQRNWQQQITNFTCFSFSAFFMSVDHCSQHVVMVAGVQVEALVRCTIIPFVPSSNTWRKIPPSAPIITAGISRCHSLVLSHLKSIQVGNLTISPMERWNFFLYYHVHHLHALARCRMCKQVIVCQIMESIALFLLES